MDEQADEDPCADRSQEAEYRGVMIHVAAWQQSSGQWAWKYAAGALTGALLGTTHLITADQALRAGMEAARDRLDTR